MKTNKQTPEILDYVLSCFREKEAEILEFGRMIEAEFDELGRRVTVFVKGSTDYADFRRLKNEG